MYAQTMNPYNAVTIDSLLTLCNNYIIYAYTERSLPINMGDDAEQHGNATIVTNTNSLNIMRFVNNTGCVQIMLETFAKFLYRIGR